MHGNYAMHKDGLVAGRDERRDGGPGHPNQVERPELLDDAGSIEGRGLRRSVRVLHAQPHYDGGDVKTFKDEEYVNGNYIMLMTKNLWG